MFYYFFRKHYNIVIYDEKDAQRKALICYLIFRGGKLNRLVNKLQIKEHIFFS